MVCVGGGPFNTVYQCYRPPQQLQSRGERGGERMIQTDRFICGRPQGRPRKLSSCSDPSIEPVQYSKPKHCKALSHTKTVKTVRFTKCCKYYLACLPAANPALKHYSALAEALSPEFLHVLFLTSTEETPNSQPKRNKKSDCRNSVFLSRCVQC